METRKLVSLPAELARAVTDYRVTNRIGSESEAIRRLIEAGLKIVRKPLGGADGGQPRSSTRPRTKSAPREPSAPKAAPMSNLDQRWASRERAAR